MASKGKVSIVGIVAWILVAVLALAAGTLGFLGSQQAGRAAQLREALVQVAATAGVQEWKAEAPAPAAAPAEGSEAAPAEAPAAAPAEPQALTADALKDAAGLSNVVQQVQAAIQATQQELATSQGALATAQGEVSSAKAEVATLQEQAAKVEGLTTDLAAKDEAIAAAKAQAEKVAQEVKAAQEAAAQQKAELEGNLESLKTRMAVETDRLQAELDAAQAAATAEASAPADGEQPQGPAPDVLVDALAENPPAEPVGDEEPGRVLGPSAMISVIQYSAADQALVLRLLDGQELTYRNVPQEAYDQLVEDGTKVDMVYKFKIQGAYPSLPPDSTVVRKFLKWQRRNKEKGDVRVIEPELPLVIVDEEPVAEEANPGADVAPTEAPAVDAAPAPVEPPAAEAAPAAAPVPAAAPAVVAAPAGN